MARCQVCLHNPGANILKKAAIILHTNIKFYQPWKIHNQLCLAKRQIKANMKTWRLFVTNGFKWFHATQVKHIASLSSDSLTISRQVTLETVISPLEIMNTAL